MLYEWNSWCRLCAKESGNEIDVSIKDEQFYSIAHLINKYFSITINNTDEIPHQICSECHEFIISLYSFSEKLIKVQELFTELQLDGLTDLKSLRTKYNLKENNFHEESVNDILDVQLLKDWNTKADEPKINIKRRKSKDETEISLSPKPDNKIEMNKEVILKKQNSIDFSDSEIEHVCEICEKTFSSQRGHTLHMKFKHSIGQNSQEPFPCQVCDKVFQKIQNLTEHKKLHLPADERKWFPCPHCDKKFAAFWYVSVHIRTIHEKERLYICEECGKAFATGDRLAAHKLVHTDLKPFKCSKCSKSFKCAPSLKHHVDSHEDTKYICSICGIQLNTKRILRRHMIVHSDKKKYKCNFCEKEFKRLDAFKHHLILHTGLRPYQCQFCEQTFANGSNCRKHQKHSHSKELAVAEKKGEQNIPRNIPSMKQLKAVNEDAILDSKKGKRKDLLDNANL